MAKIKVHVHTNDAFDEAASQALQLINKAGDILYKANLQNTKDPKVAGREAVIRSLLEAKTLAQKV
jgi:hypothetical protein